MPQDTTNQQLFSVFKQTADELSKLNSNELRKDGRFNSVQKAAVGLANDALSQKDIKEQKHNIKELKGLLKKAESISNLQERQNTVKDLKKIQTEINKSIRKNRAMGAISATAKAPVNFVKNLPQVKMTKEMINSVTSPITNYLSRKKKEKESVEKAVKDRLAKAEKKTDDKDKKKKSSSDSSDALLKKIAKNTKNISKVLERQLGIELKSDDFKIEESREQKKKDDKLQDVLERVDDSLDKISDDKGTISESSTLTNVGRAVLIGGTGLALAFSDEIQNLFKGVGISQILGKVGFIQKLVTPLKTFMTGTFKLFEPIMNIVAKGGSFVKTWIPFGEKLGKLSKVIFPFMKKLFIPFTVIMAAIDTIRGAIDGFKEGGIVSAAVGAVKGLYQSLIGDLVDIIMSLGKGLFGWLESTLGYFIPDSVKSIFGKSRNTLNRETSGMFNVSAGLGEMTSRFEGNPDTISNTKGDRGGKSYGKYQLTSAGGESSNIARFINSDYNKDFQGKFAGLSVGSEGFDNAFKSIANDAEFIEAQRRFMLDQYFNPVRDLASEYGVDVSDRRVQEALFSSAMNNGVGGTMGFLSAMKDSGALGKTNEEFIRNLQDARISMVRNSTKIDASLKPGLISRYQKESDILTQPLPAAYGSGSGLNASFDAVNQTRDKLSADTSLAGTTPVAVSAPNITSNQNTNIINTPNPRNVENTFIRHQDYSYSPAY